MIKFTCDFLMILKTMISILSCVWLGLELNSAGKGISRARLKYRWCILTRSYLPCYLYFFPRHSWTIGPANRILLIHILNILNGVVQPKMKTFVIIYSSSCCSKPVWNSFFCWTQRKILRTIVGSHWPPYNLFPYSTSKWLPETVHSSQYLLIEMHTGFGATLGRVNEDNFHFWVN